MKIVKNILCILFGLLFINAGLDKLLHYMPVPPMDINMHERELSALWLFSPYLLVFLSTI